MPTLPDLQVSHDDVQRMQLRCEDLKRYFSLAERQEIVQSGKRAKVRYDKTERAFVSVISATR